MAIKVLEGQMSKKIEEIVSALNERTPKQVRTLRNQLNNRIKSFEEELQFGKKVGKLSESHTLYGLNLKDCQDLLLKTKQALKNVKSEQYEND
jgi:hypothetical protein